MNQKVQKKIRYICFFLIIFLILEIVYVSYNLVYKKEKSLYFDGINAIEKYDDYYIAVGSNNNNDKNYEKAKLTKYNSKREKIYEYLYNVGYNSSFFGVCIDKDSIVAVGSYEKSKVEHEDLIRRALIVKYDMDGNVLFEKDFQLLDNSKFTSVKAVDDGYLVTGQSVYKNTRIGNDTGGAILIKYDLDGNIIWKQTYGSNKSAIFNDLLVVNGAIYTVGTDADHVGILCKYDLDGNYITYNDYLYIDDLGFSGIVSVGDELFVSGANRNNNTTNAMIVKYDFDCTYIEEKVYANDGSIRYNKLIKDNNDNLIAIGIISSKKEMKDKTTTAEQLNYDGIIGKYDTSLQELQVEIYGDERDDYFTDLLLEENGYMILGYSSYEDGSYLSKFIHYSEALKVLGVD